MKQYRFLEVTTVYPIYLQSLYNNKPKMNSFEEFMNCYFESCYCESNYIERYLESELGIEAQLVCYNNEYAQNCWDSNTDKDPFHILLRQIKAINPDVLYISDINIFTPDQILCIKNTGKKGMKLICYHFSFLTKNVINTLKHYDLCFTGSLKYVKEMSNYTKNVKLVRHTFESTLLDKINVKNIIQKPVFAGSIFLGEDFHSNRIDMLGKLYKNNIPYDFYGNLYIPPISKLKKLFSLLQPAILSSNRTKTIRYLRKIAKPSCFGLDYYNTLASYLININNHAPIAGTGCGNLRMFEVTGIGSCLVTDYREENKLLFDEDNEIVVYKDNEELVDKVKFLLNHPEEAKRIATNGQKKTLNNYTYKHKALLINDYIQELL